MKVQMCIRDSPLQGPTLAKALEASGVPNRVEVYDNAKHGIGIGVGTDAEDWVEPVSYTHLIRLQTASA